MAKLPGPQMRILAIAYIDDGAVSERLFREMNGISRSSVKALVSKDLMYESKRPMGSWRMTPAGRELVKSWLCR